MHWGGGKGIHGFVYFKAVFAYQHDVINSICLVFFVVGFSPFFSLLSDTDECPLKFKRV